MSDLREEINPSNVIVWLPPSRWNREEWRDLLEESGFTVCQCPNSSFVALNVDDSTEGANIKYKFCGHWRSIDVLVRLSDGADQKFRDGILEAAIRARHMCGV